MASTNQNNSPPTGELRQGFLTLVDQGIYSGTRFLTSLIVGRVAGANELGIYSLAFAAIILATVIQESIITTPALVMSNKLNQRTRSFYLGASCWQNWGLCAIFLIGFLIGGLITNWVSNNQLVAQTLFVLAIVVPCCLIREFVRKLAMAKRQVGVALSIDTVSTLLHLAVLGYLIWSAELTALTTMAAIGVSCFVPAIISMAVYHNRLSIKRHSLGAYINKNWQFGRWLLLAQVSGVFTGYAPYWVLAVVWGTQPAGQFAACHSIVLLSNPLMAALANYVTPHGSRRLAQFGYQSFKVFIQKLVLLVTIGSTVFAILMGAFGESLVTLIYGAEYSLQGNVMLVMSLCLPLWAMACIWSSGICAIEKTSHNFLANLIGLLVTIFICMALVHWSGKVGVAIGLLAGSLATAIFQGIAFHKCVQTEPSFVAQPTK